jgi:hypothetical protein
MTRLIKYRSLWILAWFIGLLLFSIASHWHENASQTGLYIFLSGLDSLTTINKLTLSVVVVFLILMIGGMKSNEK